MSIEESGVYERCEPDDPRRCQAVVKHGGCLLKAIDGHNYCRIHFGIGHKVAEQEAARNYRLNTYQRRVNEFADNNQVKSLREEIGILRMVLEQTINKCQNDTELLLYSNRISDLVIKIEKLVASCHKLELANNQLLDRDTILFLGDIIIKIVGEVIPADQIQSVSDRIFASIANINQLALAPEIENAEFAP